MLGSIKNAEYAAKADQVIRDRYWIESVQYGWTTFKFLGAGISRTALKCLDDGLVYKVENRGNVCQTDTEEAFFAWARRKGMVWAPESTLYNIDGYYVTVMPYYPTSGRKYDSLVYAQDSSTRALWREINFMCSDTHSDNIGWDGDKPKIIDGGISRGEMGCDQLLYRAATPDLSCNVFKTQRHVRSSRVIAIERDPWGWDKARQAVAK